MIKILVSDALSEEGLKVLREVKEFQVDVKTDLKPDELKVVIKDYDALVVRSATKVTKEIIDSGAKGNLKIIGRSGVGTDNIDLEAAYESGVIVKFAPSGATNSVSELTIGLMLSMARDIPNSNYELKKGNWNKKNGTELFNKTLGVIACGRIGRKVSNIAKHGFEMNVLGYDPFPSKEVEEEGIIRMVENLEHLLAISDYVTIHAPRDNKKAPPIIGKEELWGMKKSAYLIDVSRGGNVDEDALYEALKSEHIAGAAKDVYIKEGKKGEKFENKLLELENFIGLPHLGASTDEGQAKTGKEMADVIIKYLKYGDSVNAVNIKRKEKEEKSGYNLFVVHEDKPGVFSEISGKFGAHNINIIDQKTEYLRIEKRNGLNQEEKKGVTVYCAENEISDTLINEIKSIKEVYSAKK